MKKQDLINKINENKSHREIAKDFNVCQTTIKYWLKKYNLKTHWKRNVIIYTHCSLCGRDLNKNRGSRRHRCNTCTTRLRRYRIKLKAIKYLGGKCNRCGWFGNIAAFEFHHIDKSKKKFEIGRANNKSWEVVVEELKKCELLCSNCHKIEHSKYDKDEKFMNELNNFI